MNRTRLTTAIALLLALPALALAQPNITGISPGKTSANTGATVDITGTGFGASFADVAFFPGGGAATPLALIPGGIRVRVPATWSGGVQVQAAGVGPLSNAFNLDISFSWSGQYWPGGSLPFTWFLNNAAAPGCTFNDTRDALIDGYNAWTCASGVSMSYGGGTALAVTAYDGVNCRYWSSSGWSSGTVAVANWWYNSTTNQTLEADIAFNSQHYTWSTTGASTAMDVGNVCTHEEGHTIGLLDMYGSADFPHTMYGYVANGEVLRRTLHTDDALGAEWIYPHARPNLTAATPAGWWGPVVPRMLADANGSYAPLPATLTGNATCYVNTALTNNGGDCAAPSNNNQLLLDEEAYYNMWWNGVLGAGFAFGGWTNWGMYVRGGRHTLRWDLDTGQETLESNEFDNTYREQFVWSPYALSDMTPLARTVPPPRGVMADDNCDGFQFTGNYWGAVGVIPVSSAEDFDVELFNDYAGSTAGFSNELAVSPAGSGGTDFVLVNGNVVGYGATLQAGVLRFTSGAVNNYIVEQANAYGNSTITPGTLYGSTVTSGSVNMGAYQILKVHEVYLASAGTAYTFTLHNLSGTADLNLSLYDRAGSYFGRFSYLAIGQANPGGMDESFTYTPSASGYYGVVVWKGGSGDLGLANDYELIVGPALSNLSTTVTPGGWTAPAVPRNDAISPGVVSPTLDGNTGNTYISYSVHQLGPNPTPGGQLDLDIDDWWTITAGLPNPAAVSMYYVAAYGPLNVRGGRHTLSDVVDRPGTVPESDETDNVSYSQFVWSPLLVGKHAPVVRAMPPGYGPGWLPNCDGLRFDPTPTYLAWVSSVAAFSPGDDYDNYVFRDYVGSTSGFSDLAGASYWGGNATDFVTGHHTAWRPSIYPATVSFYAGGGGGVYSADMSDDAGRFATPPASYDDVPLAENRLADVYQFNLTPGTTYYMLLHRKSGSDELQFEVFPPTPGAVWSRGTGTASLTMDTDDDTLAFAPTDAGWHNVVVFRTDGTEAATPLTYLLSVGANVTVDVPLSEPQGNLGFLGAVPNPDRNGANLVFSLPDAGRVRLEVFDLTGRLACVVTDEEWSAGRHSLRWDGRRSDGRVATPGLYWARFQSSGSSFARRFTLVR
ncbi:MAG: IPT/TIG domain-containing protein [Candidatus Eisenbacteria bacterium]|nr:IPT/TIG domain-containing protein [Candidatus Eisenbacteria bacterium]